MATMARKSDPATSKAGAKHAANKCVRLYGGQHETYRKRIDQLWEHVEIAGSRRCRQTRHTATIYTAR